VNSKDIEVLKSDARLSALEAATDKEKRGLTVDDGLIIMF
jgi:hypothetical protein